MGYIISALIILASLSLAGKSKTLENRASGGGTRVLRIPTPKKSAPLAFR